MLAVSGIRRSAVLPTSGTYDDQGHSVPANIGHDCFSSRRSNQPADQPFEDSHGFLTRSVLAPTVMHPKSPTNR